MLNRHPFNRRPTMPLAWHGADCAPRRGGDVEWPSAAVPRKVMYALFATGRDQHSCAHPPLASQFARSGWAGRDVFSASSGSHRTTRGAQWSLLSGHSASPTPGAPRCELPAARRGTKRHRRESNRFICEGRVSSDMRELEAIGAETSVQLNPPKAPSPYVRFAVPAWRP